MRRLLHVAAAVIGVRRVQFADELADQKIDVPARHRAFEHLAVAFAHRFPVHAVHVGVVEEIALEAVHIAEDLAPLGARIHRRLHFRRHHGFLELLSRLDVEDGVFPLADDEHLLAVGRSLERVRVVQHGLFLALREVEVDDRVLLVARAGTRLAPVQELALDRLEIGVIAGLRRQHDAARFEPVELDVHDRRRNRLVVSLLLFYRFLVRFLLACLGVLRLLLLRFLLLRLLRVVLFRARVEQRAFVVVSGGQRRLHVAPKRYSHQLRGVRIGPRVVEAAVNGIELAIGRVDQVLSFRLEGRLRIVEISSRCLVELRGFRVVQEDGAVSSLGRPCVGEPS